MKIEKNNLLHWVYLIWVGFLSLIFIPFRPFIRSKNQTVIILYGHKLHGNLHALYKACNETDRYINNIKVFFLTLDPRYHSAIKHKPNILLALKPLDLLKVINANCIISDHGLHSMSLLLKFTDILFADVWHGIPFKGFTLDDFILQHKYDETWVSSTLLKKMYIEKFGFKPEQVHVTGYGRTDLLLHYQTEKENNKKLLGIPAGKKIVLFAPTWKQDNKKRNEIPFGLQQDEFISKLGEVAEINNAVLIVRYHLNTCQPLVKVGSNVLQYPISEFPDGEMLIGLSDALITDWSSIAFDMMVINKPIIFLDVPPPFNNGFSLPAEFRVGDTVTTFNDLESAITEICSSEEEYFSRYRERYLEVQRAVYDDTLDSKSVKRYVKRLEAMLRQ